MRSDERGLSIFNFVAIPRRDTCSEHIAHLVRKIEDGIVVRAARHLRRNFVKLRARVSYIYTRHGRILYNMAFNLRRIRCLATQTTAIGFHLMNQAGEPSEAFLRCGLGLNWTSPSLSLRIRYRLSSLILYPLPATYASMARPGIQEAAAFYIGVRAVLSIHRRPGDASGRIKL